MWRPEGWKGIKIGNCPYGNCSACPTTVEECSPRFEAGADAMLEALRKQAREQGISMSNGTLIFIPDEEG